MRSRKDFNRTGSKEFFQALSKLNVPKDLVRNHNRWKEVLGETSGTMATPKPSIRSSPQFQKILKSYEEKGTPKNVGKNINFLQNVLLFNKRFLNVYVLFGLNQDTHARILQQYFYSTNFLQHWTKPATGCFNAAL